MKKLVLLLLLGFFTTNFGANVYLDSPPNNQTYYSNQNGIASIPYHIVTVSTFFIVDWYGARLQYPDDSHWGAWQNGQGGGWGVTKAGTYHVQAAVHVEADMGGSSDYHMYSNLLTVYVVDNNSPAVPNNLSCTTSAEVHPLLSWTANTEADLDYYEVWKKGGEAGGDWHFYSNSTTNSFEDDEEIIVTGPLVQNEIKAYYKFKAVDINGNKSDFSNQIEVRVKTEAPAKLGVNNDGNQIVKYDLGNNYPNPFNPTTIISYQIPDAGHVSLKVYDALGKEVAELVNDNIAVGQHTVEFNSNNLPSGIYFYKISTRKFTAIKKMLLVK